MTVMKKGHEQLPRETKYKYTLLAIWAVSILLIMVREQILTLWYLL